MTSKQFIAGRKAASLTRADVASAIGKTERTIHRWEAGESQIGRAEAAMIKALFLSNRLERELNEADAANAEVRASILAAREAQR